MDNLLTKYQKAIATKLRVAPEVITFSATYNDGNQDRQPVSDWDSGQLKPDKGWRLGYFRVYINVAGRATSLAAFSLYQMPGCCAYAISSGATVWEQYRGKGLGRLFNQMRQEMARAAGYSAILCTDIEDNTPRRALLEREGWVDVHTVKNRRTNNVVKLSAKLLPLEP